MSVWLAQLVEVSALTACVHVRAQEGGSTPGVMKLDTGYQPFGVGEM